jgi:serine/threonine protein kinase
VSQREIAPGVTLSGHLISAEIGAGGFSRVFRAEPVGGGPAVAIKVAVRSELVQALRAEGAVLRRLQGPRFVKILEEHLDDDPPYFVLELCEKGDLRARLEKAEKRRLPPEEVEKLARGILEGVAFAHDEGVVHGDLKPENVLLDAAGAPKIADLGLSRAHRLQLLRGAALEGSLATDSERRIRGTFDYLAPETRKGEEITPASDVYALGVLLYELLTGQRPLGVFPLPRALLGREGVTVSKALDRVIARALAHDTAERYPDASLMLADLEAGDQGIEWARETKDDSRAPKIARIEPVNDLLFAVHIYSAIVLPILIFGVVLTLVRDHVPALEVRGALVAAGSVLVLLGVARVIAKRPSSEATS